MWEIFYFSKPLLKDNFPEYRILAPWGFLTLNISEEKLDVIVPCVPLEAKCFFFFFLFFQDFSNIWFSEVLVWYGQVQCFWCLSYLVFYELLESVLWCLTLIWEKMVIIALSIASLPFFFLWYLCCVYVTPFMVVP